MAQLFSLMKLAFQNGPAIISSLVGVLSALIAFFLLVPGPQPEAALQKALDFLSKFSKKPASKDKDQA